MKGKVKTTPAGTPTWEHDATANDSDKTFAVPAGKRWHLCYIAGDIINTATVGNRVVQILITDGTNNLWVSYRSGSVPASEAGQLFFSNGITRDANARSRLSAPTSAANVSITGGLPILTLDAGSTIRVWDIAAIDAAADDLTVVLHYLEESV